MATKYKNPRNQCIKAAFYALPDRLRELIDSGNFDKELLQDIHLGTDIPAFPVWRIPQCWKIAIGEDLNAYSDSVKEELRNFVVRNDKVMDIFAKEFGVEYGPIDFQQYHECFFSEDPDWTDAEILDGEDPKVLFEKFGTRPIDIQLYCAAERFDFPRVKVLLEQGANPYKEAYEDGSSDSFSRIGDECSYLCTCCLSWAWHPKRYDPLEHHELEDLIGWAAHETMYRWIEQYNTVPEPVSPVTDEIPTTVRQAFKILDSMVSPEELKEYLAQSKSDFVAEQHFGLGLWIRNNWMYGDDEEETPEEKEHRDRCYRMLSGMKEGEMLFEHPDVVSGKFLEKYYGHLKRTAKG